MHFVVSFCWFYCKRLAFINIYVRGQLISVDIKLHCNLLLEFVIVLASIENTSTHYHTHTYTYYANENTFEFILFFLFRFWNAAHYFLLSRHLLACKFSYHANNNFSVRHNTLIWRWKKLLNNQKVSISRSSDHLFLIPLIFSFLLVIETKTEWKMYSSRK